MTAPETMLVPADCPGCNNNQTLEAKSSAGLYSVSCGACGRLWEANSADALTENLRESARLIRRSRYEQDEDDDDDNGDWDD